MDELRREGVVQADDPKKLKSGILLIRAHGISPERRAMLRRLPVALVDATCRDVAKTQGLVRRYAARGYHVLIFGDPGHAEVEGLLGCAAGRGYVVTGPADVARLPDLHPVALCAQSTQFPEDYAAVTAAAAKRFRDPVVLDSICSATKARQSELARIAARADTLVVVGSRRSANTRRLADLARRLRPTHHIETAAELRPEWFATSRVVGLTAGASTPESAISEVRRALEAMQGRPVAGRRRPARHVDRGQPRRSGRDGRRSSNR